MSPRTSAVMISVALASFATAAIAQDAGTTTPSTPPARGQRFIERLTDKFKSTDANGDGQLSKDEMSKGMPRLAAHFDEIDTNHDGEVTTDELKAYFQSRHASRQPG